MTTRPVIFISAVSRELKTARQLVANSLHFLACPDVAKAHPSVAAYDSSRAAAR